MRYLLFGGDAYYAQGGGHDFLGCGTSIDNLLASECLKDGNCNIEWFHIFDTTTRKIIAGSKSQAHGAGDIVNGTGT
jgi:hypothetical protein